MAKSRPCFFCGMQYKKVGHTPSCPVFIEGQAIQETLDIMDGDAAPVVECIEEAGLVVDRPAFTLRPKYPKHLNRSIELLYEAVSEMWPKLPAKAREDIALLTIRVSSKNKKRGGSYTLRFWEKT